MPSGLPPVAFAYHSRVPVEVEAVRVSVPLPQREAPFAELIAGTSLMLACTAVLELEIHPLAAASA